MFNNKHLTSMMSGWIITLILWASVCWAFIGPTTQKPPLARSCNILHMENISIEIMQQMLLNSLKINKQQI